MRRAVPGVGRLRICNVPEVDGCFQNVRKYVNQSFILLLILLIYHQNSRTV